MTRGEATRVPFVPCVNIKTFAFAPKINAKIFWFVFEVLKFLNLKLYLESCVSKYPFRNHEVLFFRPSISPFWKTLRTYLLAPIRDACTLGREPVCTMVPS